MEGAAVLLPGIMGGYQAETRKELGKSFKSRRDWPAEQPSRRAHHPSLQEIDEVQYERYVGTAGDRNIHGMSGRVE